MLVSTSAFKMKIFLLLSKVVTLIQTLLQKWSPITKSTTKQLKNQILKILLADLFTDQNSSLLTTQITKSQRNASVVLASPNEETFSMNILLEKTATLCYHKRTS